MTASAEANIQTTPDVLGNLMGGTAEIGATAAATSAGSVGNRPALKGLLDLAHAEAPSAAAEPKAKAKTKAKAKAKVAAQRPKTPAEQRAAIRT